MTTSIKAMLIKTLRDKSIVEQDSADKCRSQMYQATEQGKPLQARQRSEEMSKHQYASTQFRKMAAELEKQK